jgi:hypothetical protein
MGFTAVVNNFNEWTELLRLMIYAQFQFITRNFTGQQKLSDKGTFTFNAGSV